MKKYKSYTNEMCGYSFHHTNHVDQSETGSGVLVQSVIDFNSICDTLITKRASFPLLLHDHISTILTQCCV